MNAFRPDIAELLKQDPPFDKSSEELLIGALLNRPKAIDDIQDIVSDTDFFFAAHQAIYLAIGKALAQSESADAVAVSAILADEGQETALDLLPELTDSGRYRIHAIDFEAKRIAGKAQLRRLLEAAENIVYSVHANFAKPDVAVDDAEREIFDVTQRRDSGSGTKSLYEFAQEFYADLENPPPRVKSGVGELDRMLGGFLPGTMTILAARPSMGKSAVGLAFATYAATHGTPTLFLSLEMTGKAHARRDISGRTGIDSMRLRDGDIIGNQWTRVQEAIAGTKNVKMFIHDKPRATLGNIKSAMREHITSDGVGFVVIDYMQLVRTVPHIESECERVSFVSGELLALAKEFDIPMLALSQLNRNCESRSDMRPRMSDIRGSGAIEQDAHAVIGVHRPDYYVRDDPNAELTNEVELMVMKNREGPVGTAKVKWSNTGCGITEVGEEDQL